MLHIKMLIHYVKCKHTDLNSCHLLSTEVVNIMPPPKVLVKVR